MGLQVTTQMLKLDNRIFVSYHGGSGGDMFAASCNGLILADQDYGAGNNIAVVNTLYSIKNYDDQIRNGETTLEKVCGSLPYQYISTHLFDELPNNRVSIVIHDSDVFDRVINRQLWLQRLRIAVDSGTFFKLIQNLCLKEQFDKAAHVWFDFAYKRSKQDMLHRISSAGQQLNFDNLFNPDFANSLESQGWAQNIKCLQQNHQHWLPKQTDFTVAQVKEQISYKLSTMDWLQNHGVIWYEKNRN